MRKHLSLKYAKNIARDRGGQCLSNEYINNSTHMKWKCRCGNIWNASLANIKNRKSWCPKCGAESGRKLTYEFIKAQIEKRKGKLLSKDYVDNSSKLKIQCARGHIWDVNYANISQGRWCPECAGVKKYIIGDIEKIILGKKGILLSKEYIGVFEKLSIKCNKCKHIWNTSFNTIKNSNCWCPECAKSNRIKKLSYTTNNVAELIKNKGGKLLSKYVRNHDKIKVKCLECSEIWHPTRANISQGKWCPNCAGAKKYTLNDVKEKIEKQNGTLLSNEYKNVKLKIKIKCNKCLTDWSTTFSKVQQGHWCPKCNLGKRRTQNKLSDIIKDIYSCNVRDGYREFDWLRSKDTKRKQEIDIFVFAGNFSLAIEYDGEQHFKPIKFFGNVDGFRRRQYLDSNKNILIKEHNNEIKYFIRFNYKDKIDKKSVIKKLKKYNIPII